MVVMRNIWLPMAELGKYIEHKRRHKHPVNKFDNPDGGQGIFNIIRQMSDSSMY